MEPEPPAADAPGTAPDAEIDPEYMEREFGKIFMLVFGTDLIFDMLSDNE